VWKFKKIEPGTPERNPHETEFFRLTNPAEAVVREFIQNALDERAPGEAVVKVRVYFGRVSCRDIAPFLDGLGSHLSMCGISPPQSSAEIPYLTIEDTGTTGLDGETRWPSDSNFSKFWHGEGTSLKSGRKAGRWGLGKTTFHLASKIRTFWGLTVRISDHRELLMGKALLKTHRLGNDVYNYAGYYVRDDWEPVGDHHVISLFKTNLSLRRGTDPGLSIVIPLPDDEITYDDVLRGVVRHYFYAILAGMLEVDIEESARRATLDRGNLVRTALSLRWDDTGWEDVNPSEVMNFVENSVGNANPVALTIADLSNPEINPASFSNLDELKGRFSSGEDCHFKVPVSIREASGSGSQSFYTVHLKKVPRLNRALEFYIRSGILVSEIRTLGYRRVIALLVADDEPVTRFLGDCETPAHTDWNGRTEGFRDKYENAARILRFIKRSVGRIVSILDEPPPGRQVGFLKDIFYVLASPAEGEGNETVKKPEIDEEELKKRRKVRTFSVYPVRNGFGITLNPQKEDLLFPFRATVRMAYDTRRGNPFALYEEFDFDAGSRSINVKARGCKVLTRRLNKLEIQVTGKNFYLRVTGFDPNRDLVVDVTEAKS
jgi:hypothetical protein